MTRLLCGLVWSLLAPILVCSVYPSLDDDVLGLIVFKADIQDPEGKLGSWNEEDDSPCRWNGVKCNPRSNRVSEVNLDGFGLSGKIGRGLLQLQSLRKLSLAMNNFSGGLSVSLTQLGHLRTIDLSENSLSGPIPGDLFQECGSLRTISLAKNEFSGRIPESLGSCASLASLNLSSNQFSGLLPNTLWSLNSLRYLDLSDNLLEGEIPRGIEGLSNLTGIRLHKNQFLGEIPDGIGNCLLLRSIDLSQNSFSGGLPSTMQKLRLCHDLILRRNAFSGDFPEWIGEMKTLETLDLSENHFSGKVPTSIGKLQSLKVLKISKNSISGNLPESIGTCTNLLALDVSHNSLTGEIPSWLNKPGLQKVIFSENTFAGEIPSALGGFSDLEVLNFSGNSLIGSIPKSIGKLKSLNVLDLSKNRLNGNIPLEIGRVTSLTELRLQKNNLTGGIPSSIGNCLSLVSLILSHNNLTGPLPASLAKLAAIKRVDLSFNKLTGSLPKQLANLVHLLTFNVSHNELQGELPGGGFFNTISPSSVSNNPSLCGAAVNRSCASVLPKPIVMDPGTNASSTTPDSIPRGFGRQKKMLSISALIAIVAAAAIVVGMITVTVLNLSVRSATSRSAADLTFSGGDDFSHNSSSTDGNSGKLVMFSGESDFNTGSHALLNKDCELGRGGFGAVYRTVLKGGHPVAIKKLTVSSLVKSREDFERVVKKLGKVRHPNLVALEGYYWTPSLQLLIYEFVSGGNLYKRLHEGLGPNLSWNERFEMILGTARSLAHLHQMNIIHYNIKSSNVLIDSTSGEPKLADYGLAKLLPMLDRYVLSSKIQSALGYMAPEFACKTVKITEKCDVYGFGILALEIITGKRPVEYMEDDVVVLCDTVRAALEEGRVEECFDSRLQGGFRGEEAIPIIKLGLICTSQVPSNRPYMTEVVSILEMIRSPSESQDELA
ncbi:PREDICTED: probable LRR receptor-like serine/threonine-protein kinase IRK [Ipomoea nil]|uniref:probable LRR receptor-like serine/threonine-protein kinase IRK n=1 Tax=Ipomoea nil TaxID=35883 RepID=UPI00090103A7|nr:PREDICTED: probable LRR receptor-like serine/threonine-protein kinase IRK [Ipomoea nil]XP_019184343.1 PREDICTED: probable LRR receptor-like serine/threonine-protein kinase IRK [Ipomoea nil]